MPRALFPFDWPDGSERDYPPPRWSDTNTRPASQPQPQPQTPWLRRTPKPKRGFLKRGPQAAREAALDRRILTPIYREWLINTLTKPMPAREVLKRAKAEGFSEWGIRRAKKHLGVITVKQSGKGIGRRAPWWWFPPVSASK